MIVNLAIGLSFGLIAIGIIGMVFSGVRNVINGNSDLKKVVVMLIPAIVFGICYAFLGSFVQAGVATMIFMIALMLLSIVITGTRGTFNL